MRAASYRDDVLWAIAYKLGLDPATEFLTDEGESLASTINAWVRRTWDAEDWPEWTLTLKFTPDANHIVAYRATPVGQTAPTLISRPLKVYLVDPLLSPYPIETRFRLNDLGVHVGFDHGSSVWIKFVPEAPRFTSRPWDPDVIYTRRALTYSREKGECYRSLSNGNIGHDPAFALESNLIVETVVQWRAASPAIGSSTEKWSITVDPPDWYASSTEVTYEIKLKDSTLVEHEFTYTTPTSAVTLDALLDALIAAAAASADTFINSATWTKDTANKLLFAERAELFTTASSQASHQVTPGGMVEFATLPGARVTAYNPGPPAVLAQPQTTRVTLPSALIPGAKYELTLLDAGGVAHKVSYSSAAADGFVQILDGMAAALTAAALTDPFLATATVLTDYAGRFLAISIPQAFSLTAIATAQGNPWWELVVFPYALVEPVVRGAYGDALRIAGQTDKALVEEQGAVQEEGDRASKALAPAYDLLTDQQRPAQRYRTTTPARAPTTGR